MTAIRTISWALAIGCVLPCFGGNHAAAQSAGSKAAVFSQCEALMKEEFGEAEFEFSKIRRQVGNRNLAFGELTLSDGTKKSVRCTVTRGRVKGVEFRTGNTSSRADGAFWSNDRPAGAEFVPPQPEETEEVASTDAAGDAAAPTPTEGEPAQPEAETTTEGEPTEAEITETGTPTETAGSTTESEAEATTSADASTEKDTATDEKNDDPANFTPVFRRVN